MSSQVDTSAPVTGAPNLLALAKNISQKTTAIVEYLEANGLSQPSFDVPSPDTPNTAEYVSIYNSLQQSLDDLSMLVAGPKKFLRTFVCQANDLAALQVAFEFKFFHLVPAKGDVLLHNLAFAAGLDVDRTARIMRMLITQRIFAEKRPGYISHSAMSWMIAEDPEIHCAGHYTTDEMFKASVATADCLKSAPMLSDSLHSPFHTYHDVPMFGYYKRNPVHAVRFAKAMTGVAKLDRHINELRDCFDWGSLKSTVVDVGGGNGSTSIALARVSTAPYHKLRVTILNVNLGIPPPQLCRSRGLPRLHRPGPQALPDSLKSRITYQQYDFFTPQTQRDVGAFFIRQCTHNWNDADVIKIFRAFVPGLEGSKPGTPLLINDTVMPEPGTLPSHVERQLRQVDILMMIGLGAKQRSRAEFGALLREADPRYRVKSVHSEGPMGLVEAYLD
ncbi:O-methyltransferase, partial [Penicillium chermesinum]